MVIIANEGLKRILIRLESSLRLHVGALTLEEETDVTINDLITQLRGRIDRGDAVDIVGGGSGAAGYFRSGNLLGDVAWSVVIAV